MLDRIRELATAYQPEVVELRRFFHMYPEVSWEEVRTTEKISEILADMGCENIRTGFGGTRAGITAEITGSRPGKCVALRADMDALPINEENEIPYRSLSQGVMHACGHDCHMAMLLGAARILSVMKEQLSGKVRLLFQPCEEIGLRSGALQMIREGVLEGVESICGLHIWSPLPAGRIGYRSGPMMAACDAWETIIRGKGGHGSAPHETFDPTIAAAQVISSIQCIVSREIDPQATAVISTGSMQAGSLFNIIPETVRLEGTTRTFIPEVQGQVEKAMERIVKGISQTFRCEADLRYTRYVPSTINDKGMTLCIRELAEEILGPDRVEEIVPVMASEDFSYYQREIPGVFFFLGGGNSEKEAGFPHHSPRFNVDEEVFPTGVSMLAGFALKKLGSPS
ncbi:MAG: amidohydrolase [Synergistales bacterium]|nr:amidohydrolase [Synergistales bacterium]